MTRAAQFLCPFPSTEKHRGQAVLSPPEDRLCNKSQMKTIGRSVHIDDCVKPPCAHQSGSISFSKRINLKTKP